MVFESGIPKRIFGPKRVKVTADWEDCIMKCFIIRNLRRILLGDHIKEDEMDEACSTYGIHEKYM